MKIKYKFYARKDVQNKTLGSPVYLHIKIPGYERMRILLKNIYVNPTKFCNKTFQIQRPNKEEYVVNMMLKDFDGRVNTINMYYFSNPELEFNPTIFKNEFLNGHTRGDFILFFQECLKEDRSKLADGTRGRYQSVLAKLKQFKKEIPFNSINDKFVNEFRNFLKFTLGNMDTTINSNLMPVKKYLIRARKSGIKFPMDPYDIMVGNTNGNRTYLNASELKKIYELYMATYTSDSIRIVAGYFLFACMTGLRISNVQALNRDQLLDDDVSLVIVKSNKDKTIALNKNAKRIISDHPELFVKKFSDKHINETLKIICRMVGIQKKVSFHVARHTFATQFLKMGGKVENLQQLLGHSNIKETMIYVHIVQSEANEEIFLLDKLLK